MTLDVMGEKIARCRLLFSAFVAVAVLLDPMQPALNPWREAMRGVQLDPDVFGVVLVHLSYSVAIYLVARRWPARGARLLSATIWSDVLFAAGLAFVTEGKSSLFYPFFTFAIVATGLQAGLRRTMEVAGACVLLWLGLVLLVAPEGAFPYIMRPIYLLVVGYLVGDLGEQRLALEAETRVHHAIEQRTHIARELHDNYLQTLGGVNLQVESCRQLLRAGRADAAESELAELQRAVNAEHDELRQFVRSLAGVVESERAAGERPDPQVSLRVEVDASASTAEHLLHILREGLSNIQRHSGARSAAIRAHGKGSVLTIAIDDDGRGFGDDGQRPWSIASRVQQLGGAFEVVTDAGPGAHLAISLPRG